MSEQLYRWVKAVERLPQIAAHLPVRIEGDFYLAYFEGCDMIDHYIFSCFDNHDRRIDTDENRDMIEWLEPYTPSLNAGSPVFNTIKPVSNDKLLAEYSKLRPANEDRDKDYSPLQDLFMNEIAAHLKLYTNPEVFEKAWTASLFPERLTKACLRATEQYIDSRPSLDIDKVVDELRRANPAADTESAANYTWISCCNKLQELLNQSK